MMMPRPRAPWPGRRLRLALVRRAVLVWARCVSTIPDLNVPLKSTTAVTGHVVGGGGDSHSSVRAISQVVYPWGLRKHTRDCFVTLIGRDTRCHLRCLDV
jgi:hypothetical protein